MVVVDHQSGIDTIRFSVFDNSIGLNGLIVYNDTAPAISLTNANLQRRKRVCLLTFICYLKAQRSQ